MFAHLYLLARIYLWKINHSIHQICQWFQIILSIKRAPPFLYLLNLHQNTWKNDGKTHESSEKKMKPMYKLVSTGAHICKWKMNFAYSFNYYTLQQIFWLQMGSLEQLINFITKFLSFQANNFRHFSIVFIQFSKWFEVFESKFSLKITQVKSNQTYLQERFMKISLKNCCNLNKFNCPQIFIVLVWLYIYHRKCCCTVSTLNDFFVSEFLEKYVSQKS